MSKEDFLNKKIPVLDYGYVILRDVMGDDQSIVNAARISYHKDSTRKTSEDHILIDYLIRHRHTTPLEMVEFCFQVKLPIFVERQWIRHRTGSTNELSGRYSVIPDEYYLPQAQDIKAQSKTNKQGRDEELHQDIVAQFQNHVYENSQQAFKDYEMDVESGVARELARIPLPLGTYTEKIWKINLHNLFHFLKLRTDSHAQWEIRQYARVIESIIADCVPWAYESWVNHVKNAITFSQDECAFIRKLLNSCDIDLLEGVKWESLSKRRVDELNQKLKKILIAE